MASAATRSLSATPSGELLVLSANLQQRRGDPTMSNQMEIFAKRVSTLLPFVPDVLLLQEVSGATAELVARLLRDRTHYDYRVTISPAGDVMQRSDASEEVVWDSAIVLNMTTSEPLDSGGVVTTAYKADDGLPGQPVRTKQHSYLLAQKRVRPVPVVLASIHFVQSLRLFPRTVGFCYKRQWTGEILTKLKERYPAPDCVWIIAGDFNNPRCLAATETIECDEWPFWTMLTRRGGLSDAIFSVHGHSNRALHRQARRGNKVAKPRIDYIFSSARVLNSSHDVTYGAHAGDPGFYSDHRFLWAHMQLPPPVSLDQTSGTVAPTA